MGCTHVQPALQLLDPSPPSLGYEKSPPPNKKALTRIGSCLLYAYALNTYTPVVRPRNIADAYKTENKLGLVHTTQWSLLTRFFAFLFETRMV